jgi:rhamnulokinase
MSTPATFLAIDLGASSGRVIACRLDGQRFEMREVHRFPNGPVVQEGHLHWDVQTLWREIKAGIAKYAGQSHAPLAGIGVDTWGVDFGLLDAGGTLLGNPYHHRDSRTDGMPELVDARVSPAQLYAQTGIQRLPINTLYQLVSMSRTAGPRLREARTLLMMPDLFHYWLTGRAAGEYTNATTTQFYDARKQRWATDLLESLGVPTGILPPIVSPGTILGDLLPAVRAEVGLSGSVPVIATATHDTASAVAAVPGLDERSAYISSGTWSLVGIETPQPILTERARLLNFTNEGGVGNVLSERRVRFLKNVGGLWLLQECRRLWRSEGRDFTWPDLMALAGQAPPLRSVVDPDAPDFLSPPDMLAAIRSYCARTGQPAPDGVAEVARCCLESLALKYRWVLASLEDLVGHRLDAVRVVGGGSRNSLLCQWTADACGRPVVAGPVEATALGNVLVQAVAAGRLPNIATGRQVVAASFTQTTYEPRPDPAWDAAFERMLASMRRSVGQVGPHA